MKKYFKNFYIPINKKNGKKIVKMLERSKELSNETLKTLKCNKEKSC